MQTGKLTYTVGTIGCIHPTSIDEIHILSFVILCR